MTRPSDPHPMSSDAEEGGRDLVEMRESALRKIGRALVVLSGGQPDLLDGARLGELIRVIHRSVGLTGDELSSVVRGKRNLSRHDAGQWFSRILALARTTEEHKPQRARQAAPQHNAARSGVSDLTVDDFLVFADPEGADAACVKPNLGGQISLTEPIAVDSGAPVQHGVSQAAPPPEPALPSDEALAARRVQTLSSWWAKRGSPNAFDLRRAIEKLEQKSGLAWALLKAVFEGTKHLEEPEVSKLRASLPAEQQAGWEVLLDPNAPAKPAPSAKPEPTPAVSSPPAPAAVVDRPAPTRQTVATSPPASPPAPSEAQSPAKKRRNRVASPALSCAGDDTASVPLSRSQIDQLSKLRADAAKVLLAAGGVPFEGERTTLLADSLAKFTGFTAQFMRVVLSAHAHFSEESLSRFSQALQGKLSKLPADLNLRIFLNPRVADIGVVLAGDPNDHSAQQLAALKPQRFAEAKSVADLLTTASQPLIAERLAEALHVEGGPSVDTLNKLILVRAHLSVTDLAEWKALLSGRCAALAQASINWELFLEPKPRSLSRPLGEEERKRLAHWRTEVISGVLRAGDRPPRNESSAAIAEEFAKLADVNAGTMTATLQGRAHFSPRSLLELRRKLNAVDDKQLGDNPNLAVLLNPTEFDIHRNFDELLIDDIRQRLQLTLEPVDGRPNAVALTITLPPGLVFETAAQANGSTGTLALVAVSQKVSSAPKGP